VFGRPVGVSPAAGSWEFLMRWPLSRFLERRGVVLKGGFNTLSELLGAAPSAAGITVTPERALTVPAVFACLSVLSQDVGKTPIKVRRKVADDTFVDAVDHTLWEVLHSLPNAETSAYSFKLQMMFDLLTYERAYAEIVRVNGAVVALWRLDPMRMVVDRDENRRKRYRYTSDRGQSMEWYFDASRPPIFELTHPSPLRYCRELVGTALALQRYVGKFFSNGARLSGVLQTDKVLSNDSVDRLRDSFEAYYAGLENAHKFAVLEDGMKFAPVAAANDDAQLNETLLTVATQIAGVFRVPTWKIGDLTKANYSNMEAGAIEYATGSLDPWFTVWEQAIRRDLLTTRQYGAYDVTFDRSALIRSDQKSLHDALARGRDAGFYTANDARRKLGENPIAADQGGDLLLVNGNMIPVTQAGQQKGSANGQ
jgi:HK97 family phage portal protein